MIYPNPFDPDKAVRGTLKILGMPAASVFNVYTISGQMVKVQGAGNGPNGSTEWDGVSNWGKPVATGIYYYVIRLGDQTLAKGSIILRREDD